MKISRKQLISDLNYLLYRLDKRYKINNGGCCLIAFMVAEILEKCNIPFKLKIYDDEEFNKEKITEEILSRTANYYLQDSCTGDNTRYHYTLITPYGEINSDMFDSINPYKDNSVIIDKAKAQDINWIYTEGNWNPEYETGNTSLIFKIIKLFFYDKARRLD